jgi:hypothetical protein
MTKEGTEFKLNRLEIWADNLVNWSGKSIYNIAHNISRQFDLDPAYAFAQEFTAPKLMAIEEIQIYVNYTLPILPTRGYYYLILRIYDENFAEEIDFMYYYMEEAKVESWISFSPYEGNIFEEDKKYNFVFFPYFEDNDFVIPQNFWKAELKPSPLNNKGDTLYTPDGTHFFKVPFDEWVDLLCNFSYTPLFDPSDYDLKFSINGEEIIPIYQKSSWGFPGYEAYTSFTFEQELNDYVNLTVTTNRTIPSLVVFVQIYYLYLINATGSYIANENVFEWIIEYPYEELTFDWPPPVFLFERDWNFQQFTDPYGQEMEQIYFGPLTLFNTSYYGITNFFGPPLERGTYTGKFTSPNYCNTIKTQVESGSIFVDKSSLELGQVIRIEALITNTYNQPVSGGTGKIIISDPSGNIIDNQTGLSSINGAMTSTEISLGSNLQEGMYEVTIFWTNGKEIAYYSIMVEVRDPAKILIYLAIFSVIAIAATPLALVTRRQLKQRNWEKSLKNLFVLTKEGLSLYEYSFGVEIQDPTLISAMIAALTNFVREATGSKKALRTVDQEDKKVILYHGNFITTALLSEKDLPIIHKRIMKFTEEFEEKFGKVLKSWKGDTSAFKGSEVLINEYFPIDVEGQIIRGVRQKLIEFRERLEYLSQPDHIIAMMREITEFISRYRNIVNLYYLDYYNEIILIAEQKISS